LRLPALTERRALRASADGVDVRHKKTGS